MLGVLRGKLFHPWPQAVLPGITLARGVVKRLCDTGGNDINSMEVATVTRIETTMTVGEDGVSAHIALPTPVEPGRHPAVVIIDDSVGGENPVVWAARTYGSVTDKTFKRPEHLPLEEREAFE